MAFFPLPKPYHPDFAIPGKKPVGVVEVDLSNSITRGIYDVWLVQGNRPKSIVRGSDRQVIGGATVEYGPQFIKPDLTADYIILDTLPVSDWSEMSFLVVWDKATAPANNNRYFSIAKNTSDDIRILHSTTGPSYNIDWDDGTFTRQNVVKTNTITPECMLITHDGSTERVFYKGKLTNEDSDTLNTTGFGGQMRLSTGPNATGQGISAEYMTVYAFSRALTVAEGVSLSADPYQILKPTTQAGYFTSSIPVSGFQVAWARNSNTVIQVGM